VTHADRQGADISVTVCVFVCTVTDFSAEDEASDVKFCTAVQQRPEHGISYFCELCSHRSPESDESASAPSPPQRSQRLPRGSRTHDRAACGRIGSACVDIRQSPKTDVLVVRCNTISSNNVRRAWILCIT